MKPYQIEGYKRNFPPGTEVELISMEDARAIPAGTKGVVDFVDDVGTLHVNWENGRRLGICPDVDRFRKLEPPAVSKDTADKPSVTESLKVARETSAEHPSGKNAPLKGDSR